MTFRRKKLFQPGLRLSSLIVLLIFVLTGCGQGSSSGDSGSDTQPQDGASQDGSSQDGSSQGGSSQGGTTNAGNHQPSAKITALQSVTSGETVTLDGSGSSDPDDGSLSYQWMKTAGPDITLSNTTGSSLSFVAPSVAQPQQISFQLTVRDSGGLSDSTSVSMQISPSEPPPPTNHQPSVQITAPQSATSGETVTLDGSGSSDQDGDTLSYQWMKTAGPDITLSNTTGSSLSFVAPSVEQSQQIRFLLTVSDGELSSSSSVSMQISPIVDNSAPSIVSRSPEADQSEVSPMAEIRVTFNEALLESSVNSQSLVVTQNGNPVPGSVSYDSSNKRVTFQSTSALSGGVGYTVNIAQSLTDEAGNAFAGASWNFTTGICATADENASLTLTCPSGQVINEVKFASYGTPGGACGTFTAGACNADNSAQVVSDSCTGMDTCTLKASNDAFGDPCFGTGKKLAAQVACGMAPPAPEPNPNQNASAGCGKNPGLSSGLRSMTVDGAHREYIIDLPDNYDRNKPYRLIFAWHWLGGNAGAVAGGGYYGLRDLARSEAIFVAPDKYNVNGQDDNGWPNTNGRDMRFLNAMLDEIKGSLCVDNSRVFSTGWSYGGMMSFAVGREFAGTFRAIAPMSGALWTPFNDSGKPIAAWISHGIYDSVVNHDTAGAVAKDYYVKANHCSNNTVPIDPSPCVEYQGCDAGSPVVWCSFAGPHGTPDFGPTAIWNFFNRF